MPCTFSVQNSLGQRRMIHRCSQRSVTAAKRTFLADEREGKRIRNDLRLLTWNINLWEEKRRSWRRIWLCDTFWLTLRK